MYLFLKIFFENLIFKREKENNCKQFKIQTCKVYLLHANNIRVNDSK